MLWHNSFSIPIYENREIQNNNNAYQPFCISYLPMSENEKESYAARCFLYPIAYGNHLFYK